LAACTSPAPPVGSSPPPPTYGPTPTDDQPTPVEPTDAAPPPVGEVPADIMALLLDEVEALSGVDLGDLRVDRAERVTWRDGSLGCPEPGLGYSQALVDGFWVVIVADGEEYDFRIGASGGPRLCPAGQGEPPLEEDF
jgi:hypothetical protein